MSMNYDNELREQTSALESLLNELDNEMAMEGLFSKPKSADQMIAKVKKNISKKCKTVEDCEDMLAKLKKEEEKFNSALSTMKDAAVQFKNGEIDKKELKNIIKPAANELKKTCNIISLKDINADTDNVTDEEIQKLHDFLVGTRDAINERKNELSGSGDDSAAEEGCKSKSSCESFVGGYMDGEGEDTDLEPATEAAEEAIAAGAMVAAYAALIAIYAKVCSGSSAGKEAKYIKMLNKELKPKLKEAKHTIKVGKSKHDYDMAISGCNQVIAIDEKIKKSVEELGREIKVSETKNSDGSSSEKIKKAFGVKAAATINKADDEIDAMKAQIKIFEMKKKQKSGVDDAVTEAYIAGYTRALEAMEDDDDSLEGLENASESFLKELL